VETLKFIIMSTLPNTTDGNALFNAEFADACAIMFEKHWKNAEPSEILTDLSNAMNVTAGENKFKAFSQLIGFFRSGLVAADALILAVKKQSPSSDMAKIIAIVDAWTAKEPKDENALAAMEYLKTDYPKLMAKIVAAKKSWNDLSHRRNLKNYLYTEELWIELAKMEKERLAENANEETGKGETKEQGMAAVKAAS
jgi:hypothetical protein